MSERGLSLQQANAAAQRDNVRRRIAVTIIQIRREIRSTADPITGRCRYIADRGDGPRLFTLSRREVLRRADVYKSTLNKPYHIKSLRAVNRLISWAAIRCADNTKAVPSIPDELDASASSEKPLSFAQRAFTERDDIAQKFAANELKLIQAERDLRICKKDLQSEKERNQRLIDEIINLKKVIINFRVAGQDNIIPFTPNKAE
ncbi:hypothetical protein [Novosphingobium sp. HII-3]|uniref:hypothetical protein n=1 Tax=Novosphingobium sp. HII-3 TaxID=2075565 RepID=UPI0011AF4A4A|nr:hypothetical protein [Novosphingobium sp. HII-3]